MYELGSCDKTFWQTGVLVAMSNLIQCLEVMAARHVGTDKNSDGNMQSKASILHCTNTFPKEDSAYLIKLIKFIELNVHSPV